MSKNNDNNDNDPLIKDQENNKPVLNNSPDNNKKSESTELSMVQKLKIFLMESVFIQHILFVPIVIFITYFIGGIITWSIFLGLCIFLSVRAIKAKKEIVYKSFIDSQKDDCVDDVQEVAWLNQIVTKYWISCVPALVKPHIDGVSKTLSESKPPFMYKLEIGKWSFGKKGPRFQQIRTFNEPDSSKYVLDGEIIFTPDFELELRIEPIKLVCVKILVSGIVFKGRIRVRFNLNEEVPNASIVSICFVGDPQIEFSIIPLGAVDMLSLPKVYSWLNDIIMNAIKPLMVWPQKLQFTLGQGEVISEHSIEEPITDITIINTVELAEPPGYLIVEKALSSALPANINHGTLGDELYITYRRDPQGEPITGLCVVCPDLGDSVPEGFTMITETPNKLCANLNAGNEKAPEMYLCYTKRPGTPITGVGIMNIKNKILFDDDYIRLDVTPSGKLANLNTGTKGSPVYLCYRGGCKSHFGYEKEITNNDSGLLRVGLIEGSNLIAADLCGTSDPYCVFTVGEAQAKKLPKQKSTIIDRTLDPIWDESFIFNASSSDILTMTLYDHDQVGSDDFIGKIRVPLDTLQVGKTVEQWIPLQLVPNGLLHLKFTALDFGLPYDDSPSKPLESLECVGSTSLLSKVNPLKGVGGRLGFNTSSSGIVRNTETRPMREVKKEAMDREPATEFMEMTGHVEKLPTKSIMVGISQGWQRRWFVLQEHKLLYYRSSKDSADHTLGSVGLKNSSIEAPNDNEFTFKLITKAKTIDCKVENEKDYLAWFHAIKTNITLAGKTKSRFEQSETEDVFSDEDDVEIEIKEEQEEEN